MCYLANQIVTCDERRLVLSNAFDVCGVMRLCTCPGRQQSDVFTPEADDAAEGFSVQSDPLTQRNGSCCGLIYEVVWNLI